MIALVAAVSKNGVIGNAGELPWHIPEDLKRFKEITTGKVVLMGRKTYESIVNRLGHPLPNRTNVVLTRQSGYGVPEGVCVCRSLEEAFKKFADADIFVIGGGEIYAQAIGLADTLYITHVEKEVSGDARFPDFSPSDWKLIGEERRDGYRFSVYQRTGRGS